MISTHGYVEAVPPLGAADTGGQVVYVLELSKKLAQLGYDVDIWTRRFERKREIEQVCDRARIIRVPCGGRNFIPKERLYEYIPEWCENALRYMQKHRLKYEFINSHYWDAGLAGECLSDALGVPHVHTPHSLGLWKLRQMEADYVGDRARLEAEFNFEQRLLRERSLYQASDMVVATTPIQLDMLLADYEIPPEKCRMIPPGYDDHRFYAVGEESRKAIRERLGFSGNVVLALGRLATNKGYDLLIQAFQIVAERDPDAALHLAIGGLKMDESETRLLEELQGIARDLGLGDRTRFSGYVTDENLPDYYRAADEFVLSSRYEPFGMTAIEAMASGTPTIVTVHGGLWRVLTFGRHALFADPLDREDLGITMLKPFKLPGLRRQLSLAGAQRALSRFTWGGVAHQLVSEIEKRPRKTDIFNTEWDERDLPHGL
ncbi:MAG: glycosyltransferase [Armatimonadetes bacterium]|nr:glycosyltransferase [Armatimonadota bacterium]